jgi:general secretion pathway protein D
MRNSFQQALRTGLLGGGLGLLLITPIAAQDDVQYTPNYRDTELLEVTSAMSAATGRTIIPDARAASIRVNLFSTQPMNEEQFWQAFLQMLLSNGLAAVESEGITRIVPEANQRWEASPLGGGTGAEIVTDTIELENVNAAQLVPVLRPMAGQSAHLAAAQGANLLVIVDRADNIERMSRVVRRIDQAGAQSAIVVPLQYATADEVAQKLTQMVQTQSAGGGSAMLQAIADERTNSVVLSGTQGQISRYREVAVSLDLPATEGGGARVRYLNYADAEAIADILQSQFGGVIVEDAEAATQLTGGSVAISFDANTNALVMNAPSRVLQDMLTIIDALDIPRAQVHVQAIIVEMSQDRAAQLGLTWALGPSDTQAAALTNFGGTTTSLLDLATIGAGGTPDPTSLGDGITAAIGNLADSGTSWAAVLSALAGDGDTNVISLPEIVVLDNAEAEISVGQEVPFLTGQYADAGGNIGAVNPFQTIEREQVGTSLIITPRINEGTGMRLSIEQVTSSVAGGAEGASDLITNERTIATEVFVDDGDILVLGGLLDDQLRETEQRVPGLGKIPGLGWLFRERRTEYQKQNLMVFIRPTILRDSIDASRLSGSKYQRLQDLQREKEGEPVQLMRNEERPTLPDLTLPPPADPSLPDVNPVAE